MKISFDHISVCIAKLSIVGLLYEVLVEARFIIQTILTTGIPEPGGTAPFWWYPFADISFDFVAFGWEPNRTLGIQAIL